MRHRLLRLALVLTASTPFTAGWLKAQDHSFDDLFSNDRFYQDHGILKAEGDVGFLADLWVLPVASDSARALLGVSLSNSDLEFVRTEEGGWRADYEVQVEFEGDAAPPERSWDQSVEVATFDETRLTGETIVFQTELGLLPGEYEVRVTVRDRNADDASHGRLEVTVPVPSGPVLGEPVPLRQYRPGEGGGEYIVNAAHTFSVAPTVFEFLIQVAGLDPAASYTLTARILPLEGGDDGPSDSTAGQWSGPVQVATDGSLRHVGAIQNEGAEFGEYRLEATLRNGAGDELGGSSTPLLVAGSGGWIAENWEDALSLIKYEATSKEMDILEDVEGEQARIEAWNCFWRIRDPVTATAANEGMSEYFRKIQVANANWQSSLRPGFLSDRGRVYITIGPPDDISQRPVPAGSSAYEVWTYHRYNFQILFVDRIGFNNYQLESVDTYQRELATVERRKHRFLEERANVCPLLAPAYE
ncbi:MAG: GWxTD domain-containing protein [Gemmatimonadota bacterium]